MQRYGYEIVCLSYMTQLDKDFIDLLRTKACTFTDLLLAGS